MTSQQVVKFREYQKTNSIFGFPIQKLAGMQIFEFLTQAHRQKSNFDPHLPLYAQIRQDKTSQQVVKF